MDTLPVLCKLGSETGQVPGCRWQNSVTQPPAARRGMGTYLIMGLELLSKSGELKHLPKDLGEEEQDLNPLLSSFVCLLWAMTFL